MLCDKDLILFVISSMSLFPNKVIFISTDTYDSVSFVREMIQLITKMEHDHFNCCFLDNMVADPYIIIFFNIFSMHRYDRRRWESPFHMA